MNKRRLYIMILYVFGAFVMMIYALYFLFSFSMGGEKSFELYFVHLRLITYYFGDFMNYVYITDVIRYSGINGFFWLDCTAYINKEGSFLRNYCG